MAFSCILVGWDWHPWADEIPKWVDFCRTRWVLHPLLFCCYRTEFKPIKLILPDLFAFVSVMFYSGRQAAFAFAMLAADRWLPCPRVRVPSWRHWPCGWCRCRRSRLGCCPAKTKQKGTAQRTNKLIVSTIRMRIPYECVTVNRTSKLCVEQKVKNALWLTSSTY